MGSQMEAIRQAAAHPVEVPVRAVRGVEMHLAKYPAVGRSLRRKARADRVNPMRRVMKMNRNQMGRAKAASRNLVRLAARAKRAAVSRKVAIRQIATSSRPTAARVRILLKSPWQSSGRS